MKFDPLWIQIFGATLSILLFTSLFFVGCGASEEDNSQPSIETITGNAVGKATITVSATDNSGQDSATAVPVTWELDCQKCSLMTASTFDNNHVSMKAVGTIYSIRMAT
ncbi:hypothetical protein J4G02_20740 [Candidatus Poribacteria bacterium]|nr:hypothetical protein [Candidatus Poribacteria bacterium]